MPQTASLAHCCLSAAGLQVVRAAASLLAVSEKYPAAAAAAAAGEEREPHKSKLPLSRARGGREGGREGRSEGGRKEQSTTGAKDEQGSCQSYKTGEPLSPETGCFVPLAFHSLHTPPHPTHPPPTKILPAMLVHAVSSRRGSLEC